MPSLPKYYQWVISLTFHSKKYTIYYLNYPIFNKHKELQMSVEQVTRDFISWMSDTNKVQTMLTADAMASGGVLPQAMPAREAFNVIAAMNAAFPDLKFVVDQVTANGNQAWVKATITGTQTGTLNVPMPGFPPLPPTGKKVRAKDAFVVTFQGDKVSHLQIDSPADGGIPAVLVQLGVKMPSM
jgi:predicted ester cyclase